MNFGFDETHIDFDQKKIYFKGYNVRDCIDPIADSERLPLWAIIVISIVGLLVVATLFMYFLNKKKKKELYSGLSHFERFEAKL